MGIHWRIAFTLIIIIHGSGINAGYFFFFFFFFFIFSVTTAMDNYNQSESYSPMYSHDHQEHHEHHDNPPNYSGGTSQPYMADPRPPKRNPAIVVTQIILGCCGCCCLLLLIGFLITSLTMNVTVDIDTSDYDDNSHDVYWDTALSISGSVGNFRSNISLVPEDIPSGVLSKMRICFQ